MKHIDMYNRPFYLTEYAGNNVFSYSIRTDPTLYVPSLIEGDFDDIAIGSEVVFEDMDEYGVLQSCRGLRNFVHMEWKGIPMVVFDNHNHALYFWYEALSHNQLGPHTTLVHIDEHSDLWENENDLTPFNSSNSPHPAPLLEGEGEMNQSNLPSPLRRRVEDEVEKDEEDIKPRQISLKQVFEFTNFSCNVGNYIQPARRAGIIEKVLRIEDSVGIENYGSYQKGENESLILNLDLDFFAPELDYIPFEDKKRTILHFARQADLITVATSPFFIDQKRAIEMLGKVFGFSGD
ncbi:MAG: UPF0489 family protein [Candidatus Gracilibacteria bacterium]|nr:UPF0489 family protein [Candidatus Gracilibacteria bacterium]